MEQANQATGLCTQEQMDYVNNIPDSELRSHLLHQIRLCDNLRADRDAFEKQTLQLPSLMKAVEVLQNELAKDKSEGSYYYSWQANIAMAFQDEVRRQTDPKNKHGNLYDATFGDGSLHEAANNAAKYFLDLLIS